jgi:hypothetical protein
MRRALKGAVLASAVLAMSATTPSAAHAAASAGRHLGGVVPSKHSSSVSSIQARARRGRNLQYHGGPVMHTSKTYAIYWLPSRYSMGSGYQITINGYLADASADSGKTTNVYSTLTQYYDTTGPIAYRQTFGGSTVATNKFPASGCPKYHSLAVCLTDGQIKAEVKKVAASRGWSGGTSHAFFLFLPKNAGSCFEARGATCAFTDFCAYHGYAGTASNSTIYANIPYADVDRAGCGSGQSPNGNDADDSLNTTSHEHREMTNDPLLNAWYDNRGFEGSDKCAYDFGSPLGTAPNGQQYNQLINGHPYYLQREWSNASAGCVQRRY